MLCSWSSSPQESATIGFVVGNDNTAVNDFNFNMPVMMIGMFLTWKWCADTAFYVQIETRPSALGMSDPGVEPLEILEIL